MFPFHLEYVDLANINGNSGNMAISKARPLAGSSSECASDVPSLFD